MDKMDKTHDDEEEQMKKTKFYLGHYQKDIRDKIRMYKKWIDQLVNREAGNEEGGALRRYQMKMETLQSQLARSSVEDEDFLEYMEKEMETIERAQSSQVKRLESSLKEKEENKKKMDEFYVKQREDRRADKSLFYQMQRESDRFFSIEESLPPYIKENLKNMPTNKGYIFKGCWYFGVQPLGFRDDPNVITMIEKKHNHIKNNVMLIHEYRYGVSHKVFEKKGKAPAEFLYEEGPTVLSSKLHHLENQQSLFLSSCSKTKK
jgi:hypothetical protein